MKCHFYHDIKEFYDLTHKILLAQEAQNLILLGNIYIGIDGSDIRGWRDPVNWVMITVSEGEEILLIALMTPPHNIVLHSCGTESEVEAIRCLIEGLQERQIAVPGAMSEKSLVDLFAGEYAAAQGLTAKTHQEQRIYELTRVDSGIPLLAAPLQLRAASPSDMAFLPWWDNGFQAAIPGSEISLSESAEAARYMVQNRGVYILEDEGIPVSMARLHREMRTACGIGYVYTPPFLRGRGYATACVAAVSRIALERGFARCVLYTDLANPTSNSIYQKIGYRPICDSRMIKFEPRTSG
ncbi:MAG: GNAT family N-acetyltransferase [Symbiobacteriaceae bacterium]|nr:GNAT family N-acetyltransferase [Symbiobacteriaceae bacterium]